MKKIWLYVCVVCVILGEMSALPLHKIEGKCVEPKKFNKNQKQVILKAFKYGAKDGFG